MTQIWAMNQEGMQYVKEEMLVRICGMHSSLFEDGPFQNLLTTNASSRIALVQLFKGRDDDYRPML